MNAFARDLDHPRWLYVLPNGDVLVAETNAPPKPGDGQGIKGWFMGLFMRRAGAAVPSANRITLLRDTHGSGVADVRSEFLAGLNAPFGMALVGNSLYVAPYSYYAGPGRTSHGARLRLGRPHRIVGVVRVSWQYAACAICQWHVCGAARSASRSTSVAPCWWPTMSATWCGV